MKRSIFLALSGFLGMVFGLGQMFTTELMLSSFGMEPGPGSLLIVRSFGAVVFCVGLMNWIARHAEDSVALRAILYGNLAIHVLGLFIDLTGMTTGVLGGSSGGSVVAHGLLGFGFAYFLYAKPKEI